MARCEKCLMDPCLCHISGFGSEADDEETTKKEINELMGRRCIVKTSVKGDDVFSKGIKNFRVEDRMTDVVGQIIKIQIIIDPTIHESQTELIDLGIEDNELPPGMHPLPIFFVKYDNPGSNEVPGHWYIDDEVIYL